MEDSRKHNCRANLQVEKSYLAFAMCATIPGVGVEGAVAANWKAGVAGAALKLKPWLVPAMLCEGPALKAGWDDEGAPNWKAGALPLELGVGAAPKAGVGADEPKLGRLDGAPKAGAAGCEGAPPNTGAACGAPKAEVGAPKAGAAAAGWLAPNATGAAELADEPKVGTLVVVGAPTQDRCRHFWSNRTISVS